VIVVERQHPPRALDGAVTRGADDNATVERLSRARVLAARQRGLPVPPAEMAELEDVPPVRGDDCLDHSSRA
jgi:hypothetical protein